jgi:hypothetical protein
VGLLWLAVLFLFVAPPAFLLGPLVGLLGCARPRSAREWFWVAVGAVSVCYWLAQSGTIAEQSLRSLSVLGTGAFVALTLLDEGSPVSRALIAAGVGLGTLALWCLALHVGWGELRLAFARGFEASLRAMAQQAPPASADAADALLQMANTAPAWASALPGLAFLESAAGMLLAWGLHRRIARHPLGPAALPFRAFTFSDQLVWAIVAGLGLVLTPAGPTLRDVGANLLLVGGVLYAMRGLAVLRSAAGRLPAAVTVAVTIAALVLLPFVLGGLTLLGLADTWLDFRRRIPPPATGGFNR